MGVYLPIKDYSAMQGPAPDGFHVPLNTERQAVKDIRTALGGGSSDGTNFGIALKLPFAGGRSGSSAGVYSQGYDGYYWSSSRYNTSNAYRLNFYSAALNPQNASYRAYGCSVRCFKNSPVIPTSSWTKLYGTSIESGGIFWNSSKGLISLSSDGQIWVTIADKNLGATTVWNSGDTLSGANCGKYYQRGNNYGFPRTGTLSKTSSTQVDASSYGPGNYYSSDTFIKYNGRWDTTDNGNLWGGVTGVKPISEMKNAYIGKVIEISSDLRGATLAGLQAQGWTDITSVSGYNLNSSGLSNTAVSNNNVLLYKYVPNLSSNNIITLHTTGYAQRNKSSETYRYNSVIMIGLFNSTNASDNGVYASSLAGDYSACGSTQETKTGINYRESNKALTMLGTAGTGNQAGSVDMTTRINLNTGLVEYTLTSPQTHTTSATLNSTQLSLARSLKYIGVVAQPKDSSNTTTIYTVELTVE